MNNHYYPLPFYSITVTQWKAKKLVIIEMKNSMEKCFLHQHVRSFRMKKIDDMLLLVEVLF